MIKLSESQIFWSEFENIVNWLLREGNPFMGTRDWTKIYYGDRDYDGNFTGTRDSTGRSD